MMVQGTKARREVLRVHQPIDGFFYNIPAGIYGKIGFDAKYDFYTSKGVTKNPLADPVKALAVGKAEGSPIRVITIFGGGEAYEGQYSREFITQTNVNSVQQTLLYSGRVGDKVRVTYREFSNRLARGDFSNNVEYDLSVSNIVRYKGAEIQILSADNRQITYKVLKNFN